MLKTWFSYIQPFYIFHSREWSMWLLMIVIYWFLPLHLSQFSNVHWKWVSCAFDVDEFIYEVFTIFFVFYILLKAAMRIFFESQNIQFLFKRMKKCSIFVFKWLNLALSCLNQTVQLLNVRLCILMFTMTCVQKPSIKLPWFVKCNLSCESYSHSIQKNSSPFQRVIYPEWELFWNSGFFFFYNNFACKDICLSKNYSNNIYIFFFLDIFVCHNCGEYFRLYIPICVYIAIRWRKSSFIIMQQDYKWVECESPLVMCLD